MARRVRLGSSSPRSISTRIETVEGGESVVFVGGSGDEPVAWVERVGADGGRGPVLTLPGAFVARAVQWADDRYTLVTTEGAELCISTFTPRAEIPETRKCHRERPHAIVKLGDRLALLYVRPPPEDEEDQPAKKRRKKGKAKEKSKEVELALRFADANGDLEPPDEDSDDPLRSTGITFVPPMLGMHFIDARSRGEGADLLWYEHVPDEEIRPASARSQKKPKSVLGRARIAAGRIDRAGDLVEGSWAEVVQADFEFGLLPTHQQPRLVVGPSGSAYIGLQSQRGPCVGRRAAPSLGPTGSDRPLCGVDPARFAQMDPLTDDERAVLSSLFEAKPRRAWGQPGYDAELVAWTGDQGFFFRDGAPWSTTRGGEMAPMVASPLTVSRASIAFGAFDSSGAGIALANDELHAITPSSAAVVASPPDLTAGVTRPTEPGDRRSLARIGGRWWLSRGRVTSLTGATTHSPDLYATADAHRLVGGRERGMFFELAGEALTTRWLSGDGSVTAAATAQSPVRFGYDATERAAGGAILAGHDARDPSQVVAVVVHPDGALGSPRVTTLAAEPGAWGVRLIPLPGGGALLTDMARSQVVWLDDEARELQRAAWDTAESEMPCLEGRPQRHRIPAPTPGRFVTIAPLAHRSCVVGDEVWSDDGSLRWFGTRWVGSSTVAEAVVVSLGEPLARTSGDPAASPSAGSTPRAAPARCPPEMVDIAGSYCIDRFEVGIVDAATETLLSTDYPTTPNLASIAFERWVTNGARVGDLWARAMPVPTFPEWQGTQTLKLSARSRAGVRPNGYLTGLVAESACQAAGKRLCTADEFVRACRGEDDTLYPYGSAYEHGTCNVFRPGHPAAALHDNPSIGHLDPRLNRVSEGGRPLLLPTGSLPRCRSRWGRDAVYDLVGNLDEWIDEEGGAFAGGFFSRSTRAGCEARVDAHPRAYLDYSTGTRCCRDPS